MMAGVAGMGAPLPPAPPYHHAPVPSQVPPPPPSVAVAAPVAPPPPSAAVNGQRTAEYQQKKDRERHEAKKRHEEEKRRREKERERHEREKRERDKQKQQAVQRQQDAPENRLRRDTPFLCHIRFKNDLPEIPSDPKMLVSQVQPERLAQFALTALEKEPKRDLVLLPDLGIPISLLDVERYQVPETRPPLDPADAALLQDEPLERLKNMSPASRKREGFASRIRGNAPTTWLMRTTYISNDSDTIRRQGLSEKRTKSLAGAAAAPDAEDAEDNVEAKIAAIEASFEAAQKPPRHIKNPALQPVEIMPFLPDFDSWHFKYVMTAFDTDPCGEVEQLARLPPAAQRAAAPRMMLRGFTLNQNGPEQEKFMALMVPNASAEELEGATDREVPPEELVGDYSWAKEYNYNMFRYEGEDTDQQQYFVRLRDGLATYCELSMKLELKKREGALGGAAKRKRRARSGSPNREGEDGEEDEEAARNKAPDFVRPSKMVIGTRDYTEQEVMQHQAKRARLLQEEEEG